jgi:ApaG protein
MQAHPGDMQKDSARSPPPHPSPASGGGSRPSSPLGPTLTRHESPSAGPPGSTYTTREIAVRELRMEATKTAYRAVTRQIEVTAAPKFLPDRSSPENGYFFWAYTITLTNRGGETVQLKTRHWRITDAQGRLQEVRGAGVVGEEPVLKPGENFEYTSGVPLPTPSGFMTGTYGMVTAAGEEFDIDIPAFSLDTPQRERTIN